MLYLSEFYFPGAEYEYGVRMGIRRTSYDSIYPFYIFPERGLDEIFFSPVTILYGGNGSGKSTALNVIAEKLGLKRETPFNRSPFFGKFVDACRFETEEDIPEDSCIVTSDDVFDFMLNLRALNEGVDNNRDKLMLDYYKLRDERDFRLKSLDDYEHLRLLNSARHKTESRFVRENNLQNAREHSNGESAQFFFQEKIKNDSLCLLDEPENSLSPQNQLKLAQYLEESVRYCGVQLIISTHSPFLLALPSAKIINLDAGSRTDMKWTELENVRAYYDFFKNNESEFR